MVDAIPSNFISFDIDAWLGEIKVILELGNIFFEPSMDPRSQDYIIRGNPLSLWQKVNKELLDDMYKKMIKLGYESKKW